MVLGFQIILITNFFNYYWHYLFLIDFNYTKMSVSNSNINYIIYFNTNPINHNMIQISYFYLQVLQVNKYFLCLEHIHYYVNLTNTSWNCMIYRYEDYFTLYKQLYIKLDQIHILHFKRRNVIIELSMTRHNHNYYLIRI